MSRDIKLLINTMGEKRLENVKKEIRSVLITYPKGVSLNAFLKTYHQLVGNRLPTREFGFTSDADFLYSLTDVVKVQTDRNGDILLSCIVDENTEHIQKLVSKQRTVKTKTKSNNNRVQLEKSPSKVFKQKPFVSASLRKYLFELLRAFPDGISYNSLLLAYQKRFRRPLNLEFLSENRFDRLRKLEMAVAELQVRVVDEVERLFYCPLTRRDGVRKQESCSKLQSQSTTVYTFPKQEIPPKFEDNDASEISIIPQVVKEDFEKVLKLYPDGVLARHFPYLYEKMSGEMFDLADLGFNDFLELADALPDVFICVRPHNSPSEWMVFHTSFAKSAEKLKRLNEALELADERSASETHRQEVASDIALKPFLPPEFPRDVNLSLYFPIFISAAANPGCFWFKLHIEEVICRFRELEEKLQCFYHSESGDAYKMPSKDVKIGATCAAMHEDHWYRATITSSPSGELLNVYLVDYGSWEKVHYSKLRYLRNSFIQLPAQAFKAQLALVKPINNSNSWSKKASARFLELCLRNYIMAKIYLELNDTLSVLLCDTSGDDDIDINITLMEENLAEKCSANTLISPRRSPLCDAENGDAENNVSTYNSINHYAYLQRVHLGDGYWSHVIIIMGAAYITVADLCHLFWPDKSAEVLKSRLQCKNVEIPTTTINRDEYEDLFLKCENNRVHGFSSHQQSVELYPLSVVMKVLNCLGHPSIKVRETIKDKNRINHLLKESASSQHVIIDNENNSVEDLSNLCLYDLKAMQEAVKFKRLLLQRKSGENQNFQVKKDLLKVEALLETIQRRIKDINSICSSYSRYE